MCCHVILSLAFSKGAAHTHTHIHTDVAVTVHICLVSLLLKVLVLCGRGFFFHPCVSSTPQLSQLRGRDKSFTLLHALVEQIVLHEPCLATFTQELAEFETVPGGIC